MNKLFPKMVEPPHRRIISASRRTDIPAHYPEWFFNRLTAGFCRVIHPFNGRISEVSLRPEDCAALVLWTRYASPLLPRIAEIQAMGHILACHVTLVDYSRLLEPHAPEISLRIQAFRDLADRLGPDAVTWRYDPVILSSGLSAADHRDRFADLAVALRGFTSTVVISFVDMYGKTRRRLDRITQVHGESFFTPDFPERLDLAESLADIAGTHGMELQVCCEPDLVRTGRIHPGRCIDSARLAQLGARFDGPVKHRPTRNGCGCSASVDIGAYDTCLTGCRYCYATRSLSTALKRHARHDARGDFLIPPAGY